MNYIELINQFWRMQHIKPFSASEAYVYFCLLHECNIRGWQNPFECSNRAIVVATGISEKTLIDVRNRLKQRRMIDFVPGQRKERPPVYTLLYCNNVSINVSKSPGKTVNKNTNINIKTKTTTKTNEIEESSPPLTLDECRRILFAENDYHKLLAANNRLEEKTILQYLNQFFKKLQNEAVQHKSPADAKSHFARWLAIEIKKHGKDWKNNATHNAPGADKTPKDYASS